MLLFAEINESFSEGPHLELDLSTSSDDTQITTPVSNQQIVTPTDPVENDSSVRTVEDQVEDDQPVITQTSPATEPSPSGRGKKSK